MCIDFLGEAEGGSSVNLTTSNGIDIKLFCRKSRL